MPAKTCLTLQKALQTTLWISPELCVFQKMFSCQSVGHVLLDKCCSQVLLKVPSRCPQSVSGSQSVLWNSPSTWTLKLSKCSMYVYIYIFVLNTLLFTWVGYKTNYMKPNSKLNFRNKSQVSLASWAVQQHIEPQSHPLIANQSKEQTQ